MTTNKVDAGIVIAMHAEAKHLIEMASGIEPLESPIYPAWEARFGETSVILIESGIGMVRAAAATQFLISTWKPEVVGNFGCAGAHVQDLNPGDVVIGDRCIPHFSIQIRPDGSERYVGFTSEAGSDIAHAEDRGGLTCDPMLVRLATDSVLADGIEPWPGSGVAGSMRVGAVGSADIWTQHVGRLREIHLRHGTLCEDMEAAAIAKVASMHGVPFVTIKDISNNELQKATDLTDWSNFPVEEVGKRAAATMGGFLRRLSKQEPIRDIEAGAPESDRRRD